MEADPRERQAIRENIAALPLIERGGDKILSLPTAQAVFFDLEKHDSELPDHIHEQIRHLRQAVREELEQANNGQGYLITDDELDAIIARSARAAAAQTAMDIGGVLHRSEEIRKLVEGDEQPGPNAA